MKRFLSMFVVALILLVQATGAFASTGEENDKFVLTPELQEELVELSNKNPVGPNKPYVEYTLSNGVKVVDTYREIPIKQNGIRPLSDSVSGQTRVEHSKTFWVAGANIATFTGRWTITVFINNSAVRIDDWDRFLITLRGTDSEYSNKSTSIYQSNGTQTNPAIAHGNVTLKTNYYTGDTIWEVKIKPDRTVTSTIIN